MKFWLSYVAYQGQEWISNFLFYLSVGTNEGEARVDCFHEFISCFRRYASRLSVLVIHVVTFTRKVGREDVPLLNRYPSKSVDLHVIRYAKKMCWKPIFFSDPDRRSPIKEGHKT